MGEVEKLEARKAKLEKHIREVRVRQSRKKKKGEARMYLIIGKAMIAALAAGELDSDEFKGLLRRYVSNKSERAFLGFEDDEEV